MMSSTVDFGCASCSFEKIRSSTEKKMLEKVDATQIHKSCTVPNKKRLHIDNTHAGGGALTESFGGLIQEDPQDLEWMNHVMTKVVPSTMRAGFDSSAPKVRSTRIKNAVLDIVGETGSVEEILRLVHFLFDTDRVETFALDLIMGISMVFPEVAEERLLPLFRSHGFWAQLVLLLERIKGIRESKSIQTAGLILMAGKWRSDVDAIQSPTASPSDLILSIPIPKADKEDRPSHREGGWLLRRLTRTLYPRHKLSLARSKVREEQRILRHALLAVRMNLPTHRDKRLHSVFLEVSSSECRLCPSSVSPSPSERVAKDSARQRPCLQFPMYPTCLRFLQKQTAGRVSQRLSLPIDTDDRVDEYFLHQVPTVRMAAQDFLQNASPPLILDESTRARVVYIHQGEVGHATLNQCDILVSDRATTCHIVAFSSSGLDGDDAPSLVSLAHIDGPWYDECLVDMVQTHIRHWTQYHQADSNKLELVVDIVGGFDDDRGSSARLSTWLLHTLAGVAKVNAKKLTMTLRTAAISMMNNTVDMYGENSPIGRGMGIDMSTGEVVLTQVAASKTGPAYQLRSARIWAGGGNGRLAVAHRHHDGENTPCDLSYFLIEPFEFGPFSKLYEYLAMSPDQMIKSTSTSPDAEETDFATSVRTTLRFMKDIDCRNVFGPNLDQSLIFQRRQQASKEGANGPHDGWIRNRK